MSFGNIGIQFGFALQNSNLSRIFEMLGVKQDDIPALWFVVQTFFHRRGFDQCFRALEKRMAGNSAAFVWKNIPFRIHRVHATPRISSSVIFERSPALSVAPG